MSAHKNAAGALLDSLHDWQEEQGETDETMISIALEAQTQATLELAAQARIANLIALGLGKSSPEIREGLGL